MKKILILFIMGFLLTPVNAQNKTKYVVLITLDGLRWQEVFTGADKDLINNKEHVQNVDVMTKQYWEDDTQKRAEILMPFLWSTIATQGQLYGNRNAGSMVDVANPYWFSYPGYNEILCGHVDEKINTNEFGPNPNTNILEFINKQKGYIGKTAAFSSWDAFPDIINEKRSGVLVNSAFEKLDGEGFGEKVEILNEIQYQLPNVFYGVRLDAVTFNMGFEYMKAKRPGFMFIGLDETDDFAHNGNYDYYLNSINYSDIMIGKLWQWIQSDSEYKDKTTLILTCDHGRGIGSPEWKSHGKKIANSSQTWFAVIGPDTPAMGVIAKGQYYNNQLAKTIGALLGFDYTSNKETGNVVPLMLGK